MNPMSEQRLVAVCLAIAIVPLLGAAQIQLPGGVTDKAALKLPRIELSVTPASSVVNGYVHLTAQIVNGKPAGGYRFTVVTPNNQTVQIQFGVSNTANFQVPGAGAYIFTVVGRSTNGNVTDNVKHSAAPLEAKAFLAVSPPSPAQIAPGENCALVTLTATVSGIPAGMTKKYRFSWTHVGGTTSGTPGNTGWGDSATVTPCIEAGFYNLFVVVNAYTGDDLKDVGSGYTPSYQINAPVLIDGNTRGDE